jgi:hypothetical protein
LPTPPAKRSGPPRAILDARSRTADCPAFDSGITPHEADDAGPGVGSGGQRLRRDATKLPVFKRNAQEA